MSCARYVSLALTIRVFILPAWKATQRCQPERTQWENFFPCQTCLLIFNIFCLQWNPTCVASWDRASKSIQIIAENSIKLCVLDSLLAQRDDSTCIGLVLNVHSRCMHLHEAEISGGVRRRVWIEVSRLLSPDRRRRSARRAECRSPPVSSRTSSVRQGILTWKGFVGFDTVSPLINQTHRSLNWRDWRCNYGFHWITSWDWNVY